MISTTTSTTLPADDLTILDRIAELRAEGAGWVAVAADLNRDIPELRQLCTQHPRDYSRLLRKWTRSVLSDGMREALCVLRTQLRSKNETASRRSAECLTRARQADDREHLRRRQFAHKVEGHSAAPDPLELIQSLPEDDPVRIDWERGKGIREYEARMTPERREQFLEESFRDQCHKRGYAVPGETIPKWHQPGWVKEDDSDCTPWKLLEKLPYPIEDEEPPEDDEGDSEGGSSVPREPKPPTEPGGQWAESSGRKEEASEKPREPREVPAKKNACGAARSTGDARDATGGPALKAGPPPGGEAPPSKWGRQMAGFAKVRVARPRHLPLGRRPGKPFGAARTGFAPAVHLAHCPLFTVTVGVRESRGRGSRPCRAIGGRASARRWRR